MNKNDWWSEYDKRMVQGLIGLVVFAIIMWYVCKYVSCIDVIEWVV